MAWSNIVNGEILSSVRGKHNAVGSLSYQSTGTGVLTGGVASVASATTVDITAGTGRIVDDYTTPGSPDVTEVSWGAQTGIAPTYLNTAGLTRMKFNSAGILIQQEGPFTEDDYRDFICITNVLHADLANITDAGAAQYSPVGDATVMQFIQMIGGVNISGNVYSGATAADLTVQRTAGTTWKIGVNYASSVKDPNVSSSVAQDPIPTMLQIFDDGTGTDVDFASVNAIDPTKYDDGSGTLALISGASTRASARFIYFFPASGTTAVVVGNHVYDSLTECVVGASSESLDHLPEDFSTEASLRAILAVTKGATDLTDDTSAIFTRQNYLKVG